MCLHVDAKETGKWVKKVVKKEKVTVYKELVARPSQEDASNIKLISPLWILNINPDGLRREGLKRKPTLKIRDDYIINAGIHAYRENIHKSGIGRTVIVKCEMLVNDVFGIGTCDEIVATKIYLPESEFKRAIRIVKKRKWYKEYVKQGLLD